MVWEDLRKKFDGKVFIDFNSSLDGLGVNNKLYNLSHKPNFNSSLDGLGEIIRQGKNFIRNKFQFQFGWFGSAFVLLAKTYWFYFNSSLDGLGV